MLTDESLAAICAIVFVAFAMLAMYLSEKPK